MSAEEAAVRPRASLIDAGLSGEVDPIGALIAAGTMVNERDEAGRTLLHLVAMGDRVRNTYEIAMEVVRHGGYGVDWDAKMGNGRTALDVVEETVHQRNICNNFDRYRELGKILELLKARRLPPGERYVFPCMDPDFCYKCESLGCICVENDVPGMPGSFVN